MPIQQEELRIVRLLQQLRTQYKYIGEFESYIKTPDATCMVTLNNGTIWFTEADFSNAESAQRDDLFRRMARRFRERCISTNWNPCEYDTKKKRKGPIHIRSIFTMFLVLTLIEAGIELTREMQSQEQAINSSVNHP